MTHEFPPGENSFHKEKIDCPCGPVIMWKDDLCIHVPVTINLYGITDKDADEVLPDFGDDPEDE